MTCERCEKPIPSGQFYWTADEVAIWFRCFNELWPKKAATNDEGDGPGHAVPCILSRIEH